MAQGGPPSLDEIMAFEYSISKPVQPHFAITCVRLINRNFVRSFQIGYPPSLAMMLEYHNSRSRFSGGVSVDGSVQCSYARRVTEDLTYSGNAMVSPAPDSLQMQHSVSWDQYPSSFSVSSDLSSNASITALRHFSFYKNTVHSIGASLAFQNRPVDTIAEASTDNANVLGIIGHQWMGTSVFGTNTFNSQENAVTANVVKLLDNSSGISVGGTVKYLFKDQSSLFVVGTTIPFEVRSKQLVATASLGTNQVASFSLIAMMRGIQGQFSVGYSKNGLVAGLSMEINETELGF